jgi:hypothetical protein
MNIEFTTVARGGAGSQASNGKPDRKAARQGKRTGGTSDDERAVALHHDIFEYYRSTGDVNCVKVMITLIEGAQRRGGTAQDYQELKMHNWMARNCIDHYFQIQAR